MPKIGIIYGTETTFPIALVDAINSKHIAGVVAEHVKIGSVRMAEPSGYRVIIDRVSHDIEFYRAYLKNAMLNGAIVINNPFWWSTDDKFFNGALASKLGVAVPRTVVLPHKQHPPGTSVQSMRNLVYPLDWDAIFHYVGFPAYLKPSSGHAWKHLYRVENPDELFTAYDETGTLCMVLQQAIDVEQYLRCYVVGQEKVHVMPYDPRQPHTFRYQQNGETCSASVLERVVKDALTLCRALGYDFNGVEFAVQGGIPYAIDFLNPAPDADLHSVGEENFKWIVEQVAQLAISKAVSSEQPQRLYRWSSFLNSELAAAAK
jgi:glutathione synthase/RimK-type ligase-like ATP-grasp enzyme